MATARAPERILEDIAAIPAMERGKLTAMRSKSGRVYHSLQFWTGGRNRCEYVPERSLAAVREAVDHYRRYKALTDEYAAAVEARTRRSREADEGSKKNSMPRSRKRPAGR